MVQGRSSVVAGDYAPDHVKLDYEKWDEFIRGTGLRGVGVREYYLGEDVVSASDVEVQKVFTELLADAVSVGAVVLPVPYTVASFEIRVVPIPAGGRDIKVIFKDFRPEGMWEHIPFDLDWEPLMEGSAAILKEIVYSIESVLDQLKSVAYEAGDYYAKSDNLP
jgi:hypothetical protein